MLNSFFSMSEVSSNKIRGAGNVLSCISCGLHRKCNTPKIKPVGNFKKRILNIFSSVSEKSDRTGVFLVGDEADFIAHTYRQFGIDIFEDCLNVSAVRCFSYKTNKKAIACCRVKLQELIDKYKPHVVVLFGDTALQSFLGTKFKSDKGGIEQWHGFKIPDYETKSWVCPVYDVSFVLRKRDMRELRVIWKKDIQSALDLLEKDLPGEIGVDKHLYYPNSKELKGIFKFLLKTAKIRDVGIPYFAFDYETTGLKPHNTEIHKIVCASFCFSSDCSYSFLFPQNGVLLRMWNKILESRKIPKIAQNMKYEHTWSKNILGIDVRNWFWDTMLASHILDNREKITGLKFQAFVRYGALDYSADIEKYIHTGDKKDSNGVNNIHLLMQSERGVQQLLKYSALDSLYTYHLAIDQMKELRIRGEV